MLLDHLKKSSYLLELGFVANQTSRVKKDRVTRGQKRSWGWSVTVTLIPREPAHPCHWLGAKHVGGKAWGWKKMDWKTLALNSCPPFLPEPCFLCSERVWQLCLSWEIKGTAVTSWRGAYLQSRPQSVLWTGFWASQDIKLANGPAWQKANTIWCFDYWVLHPSCVLKKIWRESSQVAARS